MRIAIVGTRGLNSYSGIERSLIELCPRFAGRGHEVDVFGAGPDAEIPLPNGVRHIHTPALAGKYTETLTRSTISMLKALVGRYDLINLMAVGPGILSPIPRVASLPVVATIQGLDWARDKWPKPAQWALRAAERTIVSNAGEVTVCSQQLVGYFRQTYGREVFFTPNGISVREGAADASILRDMGLEPGGYVLFASRLVPEKGAHELISAFGRTSSDKKLVIAGADRYDLSYAKSLRDAADPDRCVFTGHLTGERLEHLFRGACLYVLPSHIEGLSLSLLEALGYGKAILVSDIPENLEAVGDSACTYPVGDVDRFAETLERLLGSPAELRRLAGLAGERARSLYDWDDVADAYLSAYQSAVDKGRSRRRRRDRSRPAERTGEF